MNSWILIKCIDEERKVEICAMDEKTNYRAYDMNDVRVLRETSDLMELELSKER